MTMKSKHCRLLAIIICFILTFNFFAVRRSEGEESVVKLGSVDDPLVTRSYVDAKIEEMTAEIGASLTAIDARVNVVESKIDMMEAAPIPAATGDIAQIRVYVNGIEILFDSSPVIENGRTLVPMRKIFEALGAQVNWEEATRMVSADRNDKVIVLQVGSKNAWCNNSAISLDVPARMMAGRTMVPLRFIGEAMGANVQWDEKTRTIDIDDPER